MGRLNNSWDDYCLCYLAALGTDLGDETLKSLWSETRQRFLSASEEDINWFIQALADEQRKLFVVFMFNKVAQSAPKHLKEVLFSPIIRAAVYERNPSFNRSFVEPCVIAFGHRLAKTHPDSYIRHRIEVQLGTESLLQPLPPRNSKHQT
ncbi:hypothetical protein [Nostoc sp.]|uniref:hypothetical protein n=1 Tax=Nostoc sp. TaxID=1180 RepID=UPI002FF67E77